jgi:c-di-GMP-binding flagellar brake protein YcgR
MEERQDKSRKRRASSEFLMASIRAIVYSSPFCYIAGTMQQRRKYLRVPFSGTAELTTEAPPVSVTISNVSMGGLHLYAEKVLNLGHRVNLRISGNYAGNSFQEMVSGRVVVVHRRPEGSSYGVQFVPDLHLGLQPSLYRWIDENSQNGAPSFLRNTPS